jgi:AraC-like DNA-binding protein
MSRQRRFLDRIDPESQFHRLFDGLAEVCLFAKDRDGRLMVANPTLLRRFGFQHERQLLGKTDFDVLPAGLAAKYQGDDQRVMRTRKPLLGIVELFLDPQGVPTWHVTNKYPMFSRDGAVVGVMGTIERRDAGRQPGLSHRAILRAVEEIREHCTKPLSIRALAARCGLSVRQFERRFREELRMTPRELLMRMRMNRACDLLRETRDRISGVATDCGFWDQAAFTRQFRKHVGLTPADYRRRYG